MVVYLVKLQKDICKEIYAQLKTNVIILNAMKISMRIYN